MQLVKKPKMLLAVEKSFGTTTTSSATVSSCGDSIVFAAGAGVASFEHNATDALQFRICAPKQLSADARSQDINRLLSKESIQQLGAVNCDTKAAGKLRINQISCVALASTGSIAVGETGHAPRVIIFSPVGPKPVATMQEHQFGVQLMAFNPRGEFLATLGTPNDGYLYIWQTKPRSRVAVCASNRCISEVAAMAWLSDTVLVTAGVRHLRIWTVGESQLLQGRNIVLGEAANSRFTSILPLSAAEFLVANDQGQLFRVTDTSLCHELDLGFHVYEMVQFKQDIVMVGPSQLVFYDHALLELKKTLEHEAQSIIATDSSLFYLKDSAIFSLDDDTTAGKVPSPITGPAFVGAALCDTGFMAWEGCRITKFSSDGIKVPQPAVELDGLVVDARLATNGDMVVALQDGRVKLGKTTFQAHESEGSPITIDSLGDLAVSAGRDNGLQIFHYSVDGDKWEQWQTLPLHGKVMRARIANPRTIVATVGNKVVVIITADQNNVFNVSKSIGQTSLVQDLTVTGDQLLVGTQDKKITTYDFNGIVVDTLQTLDILGEPVVVTNLGCFERNNQTFIIGSANDKSIVIYDRELVASQWAHSENPTAVLFLKEENKIVSTAKDGLFVYQLSERVSEPSSPVNRPPSPTRVLRSPSPTRKLRSSASSTTLRSQAASAARQRSPPPRPALTSTAARARSPTRALAASGIVRSTSPTNTPPRSKTAPLKLVDAKAEAPLSTSLAATLGPPLGPPPLLVADSGDTHSTGLESELRKFIAKTDVSESDEKVLFPLLVQALEKLDSKRSLAYYSHKLAEHFK